MKAIARLRVLLFGQPDCLVCGAYRQSGRLLGNWWHKDGCPNARHEPPGGSDDE